MRRTRVIQLSVLAAFALATPVMAQSQFQITPLGGGMIFMSDVADDFDSGANFRFTGQSLNNSVAFGVQTGVRFGSLAVEGAFIFVPSSLVTQTDAALTGDATIAVFSDEDVLIFGGDLLYYLPRSSPFFEFFLAGGAGIKLYKQADPLGGWEDNMSDITFDVGAGFEFAVSPTLSIRLQVRDYISTFDPIDAIRDNPNAIDLDTKLQNDILWSAGLTFRGAN